MPSIQLARWCALSCLVACGNPSSPPALVDAPPDTPEDPPETTVFVEKFGANPVFVRYRTGDSEWREAVDTGDGYELSVGTEYELLAVCANELGADVGFIAGTIDDGASTYIPCFDPFQGGSPVRLTGTMKQPGRVFAGSGDEGDTADWSFDIPVAIGTHDLIALDADRVVVQRDLEILADTKLPAIDTTGAPSLVARSFDTDALADEQLTSALLWFTSNTGMFIPLGTGSSNLKLPPASVSLPTDTRYVTLDAIGVASYRSAYIRDVAGAPTEVSFLPRLEGVTFNDDGVTWSGTLPGAEASLNVYGGSNSMSFTASASWLASRHKLALDTEIPGFDPAWRIASPQYRDFSVNDASQLVYRYSGVDSSAR